jgi:hypothetical protein
LNLVSVSGANPVVISLIYTGDFFIFQGTVEGESSNTNHELVKSFSIIYTPPVQVDVDILQLNILSHSV